MQLITITINSIPLIRNRDNTQFTKEELTLAGEAYYSEIRDLLLRAIRQVTLQQGVEFPLRRLPEKPMHIVVDDNHVTLDYGIDFHFTLPVTMALRNYLRGEGSSFKRRLKLNGHTG